MTEPEIYARGPVRCIFRVANRKVNGPNTLELPGRERIRGLIQRNKILSAALMTVLVTTLLPLARPAYGQDGNTGPIQMAALLADMQKTIDSKDAKPGEKFTLKTVTPATLNTGQVIPLGSILEGHVDSATPSEHHGDSIMVLTIDKLHLNGGAEVPVKVTIVRVVRLESSYGGSSGHQSDLLFDTIPGTPNSVIMNANTNQKVSGPNDTGGPQFGTPTPQIVPGLTVTSSIKDSSSGTLIQLKKNVRLTSWSQFQVSVAVIPAGVHVQ